MLVLRWTQEETELVVELRNYPVSEIAARLGRTVQAIALWRSALIRGGRIPRQVTGRRPGSRNGGATKRHNEGPGN
jgi:hypothetical protein